MLFSPLEQFEIVSLIPLRVGSRDVSLTNSSRMMVVTAGVIRGRGYRVLSNGNGSVVPNRYQVGLEGVQSRVLNMISQTIGSQGTAYYPFMFTLLLNRMVSNLLGLVPYSFTVTSHLAMTLTRALMVWVGKLAIGISHHGLKIRGIFMPAGTPFAIIPMMVPLELLGFIITFISLSVRLFANMMAGHILLKVIAGFAWTMMLAGGLGFIAHFVPMLVVFMLLLLETGVALVQAYVFTLLSCIYVADMINGGH